ncbi:hypothetical protein BK809_0007599 [Diplodia seriata]|uniref:Protein kinase domain-containing protein n=1 Tax=Diplodia seriata TaxID=420778 RepID=A0A1S8BIZ9_9PEZI|nr:hypothetical protein BK809_0007599 [Diplodia seriata]
MLKEAVEILEKHSRADSSPNLAPVIRVPEPSAKSSESLRAPSPSSSWRSLPKTSFRILKWSFYDKKRTAEILSDFSELNNGVHEKIKLLCLASDIGLDIQHLRHLQEDESSIRLGFNIDATLKLTTHNEIQIPTPSSELESTWIPSLRAALSVEKRFGLLEYNNCKYLQENQLCDLNPRTRVRLDELTKLLNQPKELHFCIPRCVGWKYLPGSQSVAIVFELPIDAEPAPQSLFRILGSRGTRLSLGDRFKLALALSRCIAQLHMVKWMHESFRSENILFFPNGRGNRHGAVEADELEGAEEERYSKTSSVTRNLIDYGKPSVLGFEYSRPEGGFTLCLADSNPERDVYRHPDRQGTPAKHFSKIHDIYALGVVLLEIGLWQQAITLERNQFRNARNPDVIRDQLLNQAQRRLSDKMGHKYQDIVMKCLSTDFGVRDDTKGDLKLQQAFRTQVVDVLEKTVACL